MLLPSCYFFLLKVKGYVKMTNFLKIRGNLSPTSCQILCKFK